MGCCRSLLLLLPPIPPPGREKDIQSLLSTPGENLSPCPAPHHQPPHLSPLTSPSTSTTIPLFAISKPRGLLVRGFSTGGNGSAQPRNTKQIFISLTNLPDRPPVELDTCRLSPTKQEPPSKPHYDTIDPLRRHHQPTLFEPPWCFAGHKPRDWRAPLVPLPGGREPSGYACSCDL
jgi:hypothetical protein